MRKFSLTTCWIWFSRLLNHYPTCLKSNIYIKHTRDKRDTHTINSQLKILNVAIAREMDFFSLDSVFQEEGENFWDMIAGDVSGDGDGDKTVGVPNRSAFRSYVRDHEQRMVSSSSTVNVKRRMVNLLRKNWEEKKIVAVPEKERSRRHMMKERTRREKQKQSYFALQSLLPATKVHYFVDLLCINLKKNYGFIRFSLIVIVN